MQLEYFQMVDRITDLDVAGIATDHCVRATVLDAVDAGYEVTVLTVGPTRRIRYDTATSTSAARTAATQSSASASGTSSGMGA